MYLFPAAKWAKCDALLVRFASDFRHGVLAGRPSRMMCAAVSWPLAALLRCSGVPCESEESEVETDDGVCNHVWIRLWDGRVLDATADQFGNYPPVYLGPPNELHASASAMSAGTAETAEQAQGAARQRGGEAETPNG